MILLYMVEYRCFRCGYIASQKINMKHHLSRKNICNPILDNISINEMKNYYKIKNIQTEQVKPGLEQVKPGFEQVNDKKIEQVKPGLQQVKPGLQQVKPAFKSNRIKCNYCNKIFTRQYGLTCHLKICKNKKESDKILEMEKEIEDLKKMKSINTQNNITNNTINNININNYGDEDLSFLKSKDFVQLFGGIYGAIPKLIEKIHFNPKYPENHNIKYTNKKLPYLKIRKDNKWQLVNKKHELLDLIDSKCYMLRERYYKILEKNKYNITEFQKSKIEEFMQKYHEEDKKMTLDLIERTELMLLNNS